MWEGSVYIGEIKGKEGKERGREGREYSIEGRGMYRKEREERGIE